MNIVKRLRQHALPDPHDEREVMHAPLLKEAADLIEQQAERIKELEAEKQEPVAWMGEYNINDIRDHYTVVMRHKTDFSSMPDRVRPLYTTPQPAIPDGWQAVVSEFIAAWDGSADPKAVGSTCRFIRAESALRDLIAPKQEEMK